MKINFEFDDNEVIYEVMDAAFVAYLKNFRKSVEEYLQSSWNDEDKKENKKLIKACDTILRHFGDEAD